MTLTVYAGNCGSLDRQGPQAGSRQIGLDSTLVLRRYGQTVRYFAPAALILFALALFGAGCTNKLEGNVTVDGKPFDLASCRSGQVYGFAGVELVSSAGDKLRLDITPASEAIAYYMPASAPTGAKIGTCGAMTLETQNSTINDVRNVRGTANLDCSGGGHTVQGSLTFENCH